MNKIEIAKKILIILTFMLLLALCFYGGYLKGTPSRIVLLQEGTFAAPVMVKPGDLVIIIAEDENSFTTYKPKSVQYLEYLEGIGFVD